jgi:hypothetical protein
MMARANRRRAFMPISQGLYVRQFKRPWICVSRQSQAIDGEGFYFQISVIGAAAFNRH